MIAPLTDPNTPCLLCDEPREGYTDLCATHLEAYRTWARAQEAHSAYIEVRVSDWLAAIARESIAMMERVAAECDHMRARAKEAREGKIPLHHLANSVILHCNLISAPKEGVN